MTFHFFRRNGRKKVHKYHKSEPVTAEGLRRATHNSILLAGAVLGILAFLLLAGRLYYLMVIKHDMYEERALDNQTRNTTLTASRGIIYDRNMNVLATSATVENVFIDPNEINRQMTEEGKTDMLGKIVSGLTDILDADPEMIKERAAKTERRYEVIKRKIPEELADEVRTFINENEIKGVYLETDAQRYYPYASLGAQIVGFIREDNSGGDGLEAYYDSLLQGTAGKIVTTKGNLGSEMLYTYEKYYDAADGDSLVLTIDNNVQMMLENNLQEAVDKYSILNGAFGIVMDVNTADVLAMATLGSYDPNNHLEIFDDKVAEELEVQYQNVLRSKEGTDAYKEKIAAYNAAMATARLRQWRNRCVSDGYEPGSTFKLITVASGLDCGAITLKDGYFCGGHADFRGRDQTLSCWKAAGHGDQTTAQALGNSCNIALANMSLRIGGSTFYDYVKSFGFLERTGVDLPGEASGYFFSKQDLSGASTASLISASFGQTFRITPMQLVRAVSAVVNGGYLLEPHVVSQVLDNEGNVVINNSRTVLRQVISEETSKTMRELMEFVVTDGTAGSARTPGYRIGGKTGTSEKIDTYDENGKQVEDKIVSFIGVAPINDPKYVVLVALDTPDYVPGTSYTPTNYYISGGLMAAPTVRNVFSDILPYLGVEPDYTSEDICGVNVSMPKTIGMTEQEAAEALKARSLTYRVVGTGSVVTDQMPEAGYEVPGNSEVVLYMGAIKPEEMVEVPNFAGYSVNDVQWLADNAGLYIQAHGTNLTVNYVSATYQDIEPGTKVPKGSTVTVEFTDHTALD